jgi:cobalt-zinc-cadmium efflux system membrane fusion protein
MRRVSVKLAMVMAFAMWAVLAGCNGEEAQSDHGDNTQHADHDHLTSGESGAGIVEDQYEDGDHEGHSHGQDGHGEEGVVFLSPEAVQLAGIRVDRVQRRDLSRTIELPGEIGFNEDRLAHVTPRFAGVAREVHGRIGAYVREGDVLAVVESNESLSHYNVVAPISGRIIEKHVTAGEFVTEDSDLFVIADLSTVWANCEVYAKDMPFVRQGTKVSITAVEGGEPTEATLTYVAPVYSEATRSALARAVLINNGDVWRPGTFIKARVPVATDRARLVVERDAVQVLGDLRVIFRAGDEEGEFEAVPVETGITGEHLIEITHGLEEDDSYVAAGAFDLKAKVVTANLDAHAGHGH